MKTGIQFYDSQKIDSLKWNNCIAQNDNGLIYAEYQYLCFLAKKWSAIIIDDYKAVLPVTWNTKWGIRYYQAVPFIQQLGLIGQVDQNHIYTILNTIKEFASYGDIFFNYSNHDIVDAVPIKAKTNLVLHLNKGYNIITKSYKKDLIHNIEKARKHHSIYQVGNLFSTILVAYQEQYGKRFKWITKTDFQQLSLVLSYYQSKQQCLVRALIDKTSKELLAAAILLKDNKRLYLLINVITKKGRQLSSNHLLIDQIIHEFAGSNLLLDFEGSEIAGVQNFFYNFQPTNQPYFHFHHNQLSWPLRIVKQ